MVLAIGEYKGRNSFCRWGDGIHGEEKDQAFGSQVVVLGVETTTQLLGPGFVIPGNAGLFLPLNFL